MKLSQKIAFAAFALAGFAGTAQAVNHEIFLGFRSDAAGSDKDLIVSLGLFSSLPTTAGVITNINADLVATYGAAWNTRTDLSFGVAGSNISGTRVTYVSNFNDGYTGSLSASAASSLAGAITTLDQIKWDSTNGIQTNKGASGVNTLVSIQDDTNLSGWSVKGGAGGAVFGQNQITRAEWERNTDFSLITQKEFTLSSITGTAAWQNDVNGTSYYLDGAGNIGVVVSAIPEPSTYGLMGAGAIGALALIRRRARKA